MLKRAIALLVVAFGASRATAQEYPVELGVDAAIQFVAADGDAGDATHVQFPVRSLRLGVGVAPHVSFELDGSLDHSSEDDESFTQLFLFPIVMLSSRPDWDRQSGAYLGLGAGISQIRGDDGDNAESDTQVGFGGLLGYRAFLAESLALRFGFDFTHWNESEFYPSHNIFALTVGFSAIP